jgi:hypothetical protein
MVRTRVFVVSLEDSPSNMAEAHPRWIPSYWGMRQEPSSSLDLEGTQSCEKM